MARLHHEGKGLSQLQPGRMFIWLGMFLVLSVSLIVLDQLQRLNGAESAASRLLVPVQTDLTQKVNPVFDFWATLEQIGQLRQENTRLQAQVQQLEQQAQQGQLAEAQNAAMRAQLHYTQANPQFKLAPATIIGKDLHGLNDYVEIDRGALDGLKPAMTVISPEGFLVGRLSQLDGHRARVLIITNPDSAVAATIVAAAGTTDDVVDGQLDGRLSMSNVQQNVAIAKGDNVVTSGLGGNFPKGLKIGQIATVQKSDVQLFQQAQVAPYCDFGKLSAVEVITNNVPID
ncbi:MAG: rod shape-determining protein MreC [Chloroflexota bacterium]